MILVRARWSRTPTARRLAQTEGRRRTWDLRGREDADQGRFEAFGRGHQRIHRPRDRRQVGAWDRPTAMKPQPTGAHVSVAAEPDPPAPAYTFDNDDPVAAERLGLSSAVLDGFAISRLSSLGDLNGRRCLEVGAGNGSIAGWLADQAGPCLRNHHRADRRRPRRPPRMAMAGACRHGQRGTGRRGYRRACPLLARWQPRRPTPRCHHQPAAHEDSRGGHDRRATGPPVRVPARPAHGDSRLADHLDRRPPSCVLTPYVDLPLRPPGATILSFVSRSG
jgi:hypothetical protein